MSWHFSHTLLVLGGSSRENSDFILKGFWKLCLSFVPLVTGVCAQTLAEGRRGGPETESVLLITQHLLLVIIACLQRPPPPPPATHTNPDRPRLLFLKPHLNNKCLYPKLQIGVVQCLQRALWTSGRTAYTITGSPSGGSVKGGMNANIATGASQGLTAQSA